MEERKNEDNWEVISEIKKPILFFFFFLYKSTLEESSKW